MTKGSVTLPLKIGRFETDEEFRVIPNLNEDILLGATFLTREDATLDYHLRRMYFGVTFKETVHWKIPLNIGTNPTQPSVESNDIQCPPEFLPQISNVLNEFPELFAQQPTQCTTTTVKHKIVLKENKIISEKRYPASPEKKNA